MHIAFLAITIMAALANGYAAALSLAGAEFVTMVADRVRVSQRWMVPFGVLLAAGALGLLTGLAIPVIGGVAAAGLVVYFIGAVSAHIRVRDPGFGGAAFFLVLAMCALLTNLADHDAL